MKKILKIAASIYLMFLPILTLSFANWFVNYFSHFSSYETMRIGSSVVPRATVIVLVLVIACLMKMWLPCKEQEHKDTHLGD